MKSSVGQEGCDCFHVSQAGLTSTQDTDVLAGRNVLDTLRVITGKWKILPQPTASLHAVHSTFCFNFVSNSFISPREKERAIA